MSVLPTSPAQGIGAAAGRRRSGEPGDSGDPAPQNAAVDPALASALRIAVTRLSRRMRYSAAGASPTGITLTPTQSSALASLAHHALTPGELADHEKIRPPSVSRIAAALQDLGLVERVDHPSDRRQYLLTITGAGRELLAAERRSREAWLACRLRELSAEDQLLLARAVAVLDQIATS